MLRLAGKRIAILGGTSGIGLAVARAALDEGASVLVASGRAESVQRAQAMLPTRALTAQIVDMRSEAAISGFFDTAGAFDHVVYTAGENLQLGSLATTELRAARAAFEIRYFGALAIAKFAAPVIRAGGSIVFTTGVASARPGSGWTSGASITSAVEGLTRALAVELAPIRVNAVSPGVVRTPLWGAMGEAERQELYDSQAAHLLVGHVGEAAEIATAYVYLMENSYATGTVTVADGGYMLV
jgi:NAD(P)-dependent dehydrogenase (short-subunit alcohol dehydrogenase family)